MVFHLLQWNARSLIANGQEFKKFVVESEVKFDIVCIQETWLRPHLDFILPGYESVRFDRDGNQGGGCATFVRDGIPFRRIETTTEIECVIIEIYKTDGHLVVINLYNPCKSLSQETLEEIMRQGNGKEIWCGDFNAHNSLWGSKHTDRNGEAVEELMDVRQLVCLNNGNGTRIDIRTNTMSCIDLTLVSNNMANSCEWKVKESTSIGSDHFPILCSINIEIDLQERPNHKKWDFAKADWVKFKEICCTSAETISMQGDIEECASEVTHLILNAALKSIPYKVVGGKRKMVPWWNDTCTKAIKERNRAMRMLRNNLNQDNLINYQKKKAQARRIIKKSKQNAWRSYCSTIGSEVKIGEVWSMLKKMSGKKVYAKIPVLEDDGILAITDKEKATMLGKKFASVHSGDHLDDIHRLHKEKVLKENRDVYIKKDNEESTMDAEMNMNELVIVLNGIRNTATGEDQLSYVMFQKLPEKVLQIILQLFNKIWEEGKIPKSWKSALILPFNKPGKNSNNAGNYRPIALTSHLCKWMEKILVRRLNYTLEHRGLFAPYQSGFRKGRSTMDAVVKVSNEIEKTFKMKEIMSIVFFDIEKAYDSMWREGLLIKMNKMGIRGKLYNWVLEFLSERRFRVKVGADVSEEFEIVNGIPQGSVISPVLFNVMINDIFMNLDRRIGSALYADDGAIWVRGRDAIRVRSKIKEAIGEVEQWSYNWGFKLSTSKSCHMIFTRKKGIDKQKLQLYGHNMETVDHFKYLGIWLDQKGTWKTHIEKVESKCKKVINLMRAVVGKDWGANKQSLMYIYRALMRATIDYGCYVYGATAKTHLLKLDRVSNKALRICAGVMRSTPIKAIQVELGEVPSDLRRDKIMLTYWSRLSGCGFENHAKSIIQECWEYSSFKGNGFGWVIKTKSEEYRVNNIWFNSPTPISNIPIWLFPRTEIDLNILELKNEWEESRKGHLASQYIRNKYYSYLDMYTDGSKDEEDKVGIGIYIPTMNISIGKRLPDQASVYTAEMMAIIVGLQWVEEVKPDRVVCCVDSVAALYSIQNMKSNREDLMLEIQQSLFRLQRLRIDVRFCWVPAHTGVQGNEGADNIAKKSTKMNNVINIPLGKGEAKAIIKKEMLKKWQDRWDVDKSGRKYYSLQKSINAQGVNRSNRREESVLTRLRFDHTGLNKTLFLMGKSPSDECLECRSKEDVEHVLLYCKKYRDERMRLKQKISQTGRKWNLEGLLGTTGDGVKDTQKAVIQYLKNIGIYNRI